MILGIDILLELVKAHNIVEGLSERELTSPEGAGFDIRLGEVYKISGEAFLGITERQTPQITLVAKYSESEQQELSIQANDFFLVKTVESVNMLDTLTAHIFPRSTLFRSGLFLEVGQVPPGYKGRLVFGLKNVGAMPVKIELGARIAHIQFEEVKGGGRMYKGQWQGGRVTTEDKEKQI